MPALRLIRATLLAALAASPAQAELIGWLFISGDLQATTSTCIGSNESPVCLAETAIACRILFVRYASGQQERDPYDEGLCHESLGFSYPLHPMHGDDRGGLFYIYLLEVYRLEGESHPDKHIGVPGDIIVDVYLGNCTDPYDQPNRTVSGSAPPICRGYPFDRHNRYDECGGADSEGALIPSMSLLVRPQADGFHMISAYNRYGFGPPCHGRGPDRWYDGFERLIYYRNWPIETTP